MDLFCLGDEEKEALNNLRLNMMNKKRKLKIAYVLLQYLNLVDRYPSMAPVIGCLWLTSDSFLIDSLKFGNYTGFKANSLNRNLRMNGFQCKKTSAKLREMIPQKYDLTKFGDLSKYYLRSSKYFTKQTTEEEAYNWKYHRNKEITNFNLKSNEINDLFFIDDENSNSLTKKESSNLLLDLTQEHCDEDDFYFPDDLPFMDWI